MPDERVRLEAGQQKADRAAASYSAFEGLSSSARRFSVR